MLQSTSLISLVALTIVGQALATPVAQPGSFTLPIHKRVSKRTNGLSDLETRIRQHQSLKAKYGVALDDDVQRRLSKRASSSQISMAGNDESYYTSISLGTPAYTYEVALDTGSADLVMVTSDTNDQACSGQCQITARLYPGTSGSSTAKSLSRTVDITYGTGSANGILVSDTMTMGTFTASQNIAACDNVTGLTTSSDQTGLMGLAFRTLSASDSMPFIEGLYTAGSLSQPLFTLAGTELGPSDVQSFQDVVPGGFLTIGATNSSLYTGSINYVSLSGGQGLYWQVPLDAVNVQGTDLGLTAQAVVIDSGTNAIAVPQQVASAIYSAIPGSQAISGSGGLYAYPCATNVNLSLTFGGVVYTMPSKNFNTGSASSSSNEYCVGAVSSLGSGAQADSTFIVGTPFLMSLYQVYRFNPPAVGFAAITTNTQILESSGIPTSNGTDVASEGSTGTSSGTASSTGLSPPRGTGGGTSTGSGGQTSGGVSGGSSNYQNSIIGSVAGLFLAAFAGIMIV